MIILPEMPHAFSQVNTGENTQDCECESGVYLSTLNILQQAGFKELSYILELYFEQLNVLAL